MCRKKKIEGLVGETDSRVVSVVFRQEKSGGVWKNVTCKFELRSSRTSKTRNYPRKNAHVDSTGTSEVENPPVFF